MSAVNLMRLARTSIAMLAALVAFIAVAGLMAGNSVAISLGDLGAAVLLGLVTLLQAYAVRRLKERGE
jgi:hypothetical protein